MRDHAGAGLLHRPGLFFARPREEAELHRLLDQKPAVGEGWDARRFLTMLDGGVA